jgi:hypothetical protein
MNHRDDPDICPKEFLLAIMPDRTLPLSQRMDAAIKLLPFRFCGRGRATDAIR